MKTMKHLSFVTIFFSCCLIACNKSDSTPNPAPAPVPPTLTTNAVTNITFTTATMGGTLISEGSVALTIRGVCFATNSNPTINDGFITASGSGLGTYSVTNIGTGYSFTPSTTYHVRAFVSTGTTTTYGNDLTFTTQ